MSHRGSAIYPRSVQEQGEEPRRPGSWSLNCTPLQKHCKDSALSMLETRRKT